MNEIAIFKDDMNQEIRTTVINGEPWFIGKDVAERLGYKNPQRAIRDHVDPEDKGVNDLVTPGGKQGMLVINESGLYSLILSSKLPTAKSFKHWITYEVIPAIRKTGQYSRTATATPTLDTDKLIQCANIMASCLPENKPQVLHILRQVLPGLGDTKTTAALPEPKAGQKPNVRCAAPFDNVRFCEYCQAHGLTNSQITRMVDCSEGLVSKWKRGISQPNIYYRMVLCEKLNLPAGHFDRLTRRRKP